MHYLQEIKKLFELPDKTIILNRNEFLQRSGVLDLNLYLVKEGSLRVFISDEDEEQNIRFGYQDNILVLLDSFIRGEPTQFNIQAIKKTVVEVISKSHFEAFLKREAQSGLWLAIMEDLVLQQMNREVDILTQSPKQRYERVLSRSPKLFQEIPNRYIANYLRMSPETLSRLKNS